MRSGVEIRQDPWQCLFHATEKSRKKYRATVVLFLLNAGKFVILRFWKVKEPPMIKDWLREVDRIRLMEELIHLQNDARQRFHGIWSGWLELKQSENYLRYVGD